ncbi:MAG: alpha/beta hydrolase [Leptonema sp. (in: Bacteria)]|nr:alpha/beta hydrolase [Leptonema sp. (in: bacteria)]
MKILSISVLGVLFAIITGCGSTQTIGDLLNERIENPMSTSQVIEVPFFTNRATTTQLASCHSSYFRNTKGKELKSAICKIGVPANHSVGALDSSTDVNPDRDIYFLIGGYESKSNDSIYSIAESAKEVMLFVHGFNVGFEEAILRAAQIKYDVKYQKPIILFTWPAGSGDGMLDSVFVNRTYTENQKNAQDSIESLATILDELYKRKVKVNLIVHSMGHQIAIPAILKLVKERGRSNFLNQVIFNAPDYPANEFATQSSDVAKSATRITVYCSPNDNALIASKKVNNNYRLGMCLKAKSVDMINVSEIDSPVLGIGGLGHGYYSGRPILVDLYQTLDGVDAERRLFIRKSSGSLEHYILRQ